jgi:hypothetical protein
VEIYNLGISFSDKIELTRVHQTLKQMLFSRNKSSDWEMILSEFQPKMINTYLITPIKRTLENKKHPNWCFFETMIGKWLLKQLLITQYKITNVNKTTSMEYDI